MAYRCEGCGKLCSVEQMDPEVSDEDVDNEGNVSGSVHIALQSACCSYELDGAEVDVEFETQVEIEHKETDEDTCEICELARIDLIHLFVQEDKFHSFEWDKSGHELQVDQVEAEADDWNEGTGGYRFQKHYWGATISGVVTCNECNISEEFSIERVGEAAGSFNQFSGGSFSRNAQAKKRRQAAAQAVKEEANDNNKAN